jgi:hypothetical protein
MGQDQRRGQRHPPATVVEIVGMLVVADQYRVHRPQRVGAQRGTGELGQVSVHASTLIAQSRRCASTRALMSLPKHRFDA